MHKRQLCAHGSGFKNNFMLLQVVPKNLFETAPLFKQLVYCLMPSSSPHLCTFICSGDAAET
jgi:hypothetical protein